jgi:hypothetical protein
VLVKKLEKRADVFYGWSLSETEVDVNGFIRYF